MLLSHSIAFTFLLGSLCNVPDVDYRIYMIKENLCIKNTIISLTVITAIMVVYTIKKKMKISKSSSADEQKIQSPKPNGRNDVQNTTKRTTDQATRKPIKPGRGMKSRRVSSTCPTSDTVV